MYSCFDDMPGVQLFDDMSCVQLFDMSCVNIVGYLCWSDLPVNSLCNYMLLLI